MQRFHLLHRRSLRRFTIGAGVIAGGLVASAALAVPIDLTDAEPSVTDSTTLHIEGIWTLGSRYWAEFSWNEEHNIFQVSAYGEDTNQPPDVDLRAPSDDQVFAAEDPIVLRGSAQDREDGELDGDALVWTSHRAGELGMGQRVPLAPRALDTGFHRVTLTATDSGDLSSAETVRILIEPPIPEGFARIRAGSFEMGAPEDEPGFYVTEVQHEVTLTRDFDMCQTEVTQDEWLYIMRSNPSIFGDCPECPVENVNWYAALEYCNGRSLVEGLDPVYEINGTDVVWDDEANGYRLPTESEWEYAIRAGTQTAFYNGDITDTHCRDPNLDEIGWYCGNGELTTHPGGLLAPNSWGLLDMSGNVWEWVWDWYGSYPLGPVIDPKGPDSGYNNYKVHRGGCCNELTTSCRSATRGTKPPSFSNQYLGFRVVRWVW